MRPNILLIMADQLAAAALPCYGHPVVVAPHLSALAEQSAVFDNAYCNFPICAPSRAVLHAGRLAHAMDCFDNASSFSPETPTLPHYLRELGYDATLCGKMHFVGPDQLHGYGRRLTTDIYPSNFAMCADWSGGREYRPTNLTMAPVIESGSCVRTMQMDFDDEVEYCALREIHDLARRPQQKPFFLTVSFTQPHSPFVIGEEYWQRYEGKEIPLPDAPDIPPEQRDILSRNLYYCHGRHLFTVTEEHIRRARRGYFGMISCIDDKVGNLLRALKDAKLADNTAVIFTADHGEMLGERGMWYKQHFFDWSARVPLLIRPPGKTPPRRIGENVSLADLMPTVIDIAGGGCQMRAPIDGESFAALLGGNGGGWRDTVIGEYSADGSTGPSRMVRKGRWKFMDLEGEDRLLFDMEADPLEQNNLADTDKTTADALFVLARKGWDIDEVRARVIASQRRRLYIHRITGGVPEYVFESRAGDNRRYVRGANVADTKARARFPYVAPAKPDAEQ
ncbi:MAG: choline-sulfatase [Gammaproteobacteria bacterium]